MAWSFGDSFDLYAASADMVNGYWDSITGSASLVAGRFSGSRAAQWGAGNFVVKSSGVNDAVHHFVVSFQTTTGLAGTTAGAYLEILDGATAQCSIVFRSDGAILLTSGIPTGTTLATYTGAVTVQNTWYAFEFEVVINNTAGSFTVRKNGNNVNDFTATSLNTRNSANNYANKLQAGSQALASHQFDDLFWQSGAATGAWLGDIRCYARMPATDVQNQFSVAGTRPHSIASSANGSIVANRATYGTVTLTTSGTFTSLTYVSAAVAYTGNLKCAVFNDNGSGAPGAIIASATNIVTNPPTNSNVQFTFSPPVSVVTGQKIWVGFCSDVGGSSGMFLTTPGTLGWLGTSTYTSYPTANPTGLTANQAVGMTIPIIPTNANAVNEPQQDALTSYVYDSNPGDADFYGLGSIASTPAAVIATTIRAYAIKSDAGTRTMVVQVKSGATTVASPTLVLTTSGFLWAWRTDLLDPNTGAAWTPAAVNVAQIGPKVIA